MYKTVLLSLHLMTAVSFAQDSYRALKDIRSQIIVYPYTSAQRIQVAVIVKDVLSMYVNRQSKIDHYNVDPIARTDSIIRDAPFLSDLEFHYKFVDLFKTLRDDHTTYVIPGTHGCVDIARALIFTVVGSGSQESVVASHSQIAEVVRLTPNINDVPFGSRLVSVNHIAIDKYLAKLQSGSSGANEFGSLRHALMDMSYIELKNTKVPTQDSDIFTFITPSEATLEIVLPWIGVVNAECWNEARSFLNNLPDIEHLNRPQSNPGALIQLPTNFFDDQFNRSTSKLLKRASATIESQFLKFQRTADPSIHWAIYKPESKNLGVIQLNSFESNMLKTLDLIRILLLNQLKDTNSLVFDLRYNSGGDASIADLLPQLFGSDIETVSGHLLVCRMNDNILMNIDDRSFNTDLIKWSKSYSMRKDDDVFSPLIKVTSSEDCDRLGQAYTKPVGLFTSGNCYSACEIFVANMKDNKIATVFGIDGTTGGGGANIISYNSYLHSLRSDIFPPLPFYGQVKAGLQDFTISWRQAVRLDGSLIEDTGIKSEYVLRPTLSDLNPNLADQSQFDRISDVLLSKGTESGHNNMYFQVSPESQLDIVIGKPVIFTLQTQGFKKLVVVDEFGQTVTSQNIRLAKFRCKSTLKFTAAYEVPILIRYMIRGLDSSDKVLFTTWRTVRFIPKNEDYLKITGKANLKLGTSGKFSAIFEDFRRRGLGWAQDGSTLMVGNGKKYDVNIDTTMSYFIASSSGFSVKMQASYKTEADYDKFLFGYIQDGKTTHFLIQKSFTGEITAGKSGIGRIDHIWDLPSGELELFAKFISDPQIVNEGVTIDHILII